MKVGLFFGTFNPLHNGHIGICKKLFEKKIVDEIWLVISPLSPHKISEQIVDEYLRLDMIKEAIDQFLYIKVLDIELKMKKPNFTFLTLKEIKKKFPSNNYSIIMGEDNFLKIDTWKNSSYIKSNFKIISYPRSSKSLNDVLDNYYDISSTEIRHLVKNKSDISRYVPKEVNSFIKERNLYI